MKLQNVFKEHFIQRFHSIKPLKPQQKQLVRLGCASLAVVLAVGAVPFLRGFAAEGEILSGSDISSQDIENPAQDIENPSQDIENPSQDIEKPSQNGEEVSDSDNTVIRGETEPNEKQGNSGTCGTNATWSLSDDGTLTISGTGESGAPTAAAAALMLLASYCIVFTVRRRLDAVVE